MLEKKSRPNELFFLVKLLLLMNLGKTILKPPIDSINIHFANINMEVSDSVRSIIVARARLPYLFFHYSVACVAGIR
jgi:hypothetical protein